MSQFGEAVILDAPAPTSCPDDVMVSALVWLEDDRAILAEFLDEIEGTLRDSFRHYEIVFVDNHSQDESIAYLLEQMQVRPNLRLLRLSRRASREVGYTAGLDHAIGDFVVLMDPYLDRPDDVPRMVAAARDGADLVIGSRAFSTRAGRGRRMVYALASKMLGERISPEQSHFRLFSRRVVTSIIKIKHRRRYIRHLNAVVGFRQRMLPTEAHPRVLRRPHRGGTIASARSAIDLVFSHSAAPLRWASALGLVASFLNLAYLLYVLIVVLVKRKLAEGWLTTSVMIGSMFFMLFLILTVLAEYVARILEEVQERPLYFIELEAESTASTRRPDQSLNVV
jgi:glycosyltransferase involved in cell wall biosynthesis